MVGILEYGVLKCGSGVRMVQSNFILWKQSLSVAWKKKSRLSSLRIARDILLGGASVPQQQKFHTDDLNQCLHN